MNASSSEMNKAIYQALCACLGLSPDTAAASSLIWRAYAEPENAPQPPRDRNVIYYSLLQENGDPLPQSWQLSSGSSPAAVPVAAHNTLSYRLIIVCYGPDAEKHALRIRALLFLDGAGKPRSILRAANIFPVPNPPQPELLWEQEGSLWRRRADLTVSIRVSDILSSSVSAATSPPTVIIKR